MQLPDLIALLPMILTTITTILVMLNIAFHRSHQLTLILTLSGLTVTALSIVPAAHAVHRHIGKLLVIDHYALFYTGLILAATIVVVMISYRHLGDYKGMIEEYYLLLVLATFGAIVLVSSNHFASFILGLEILSVSLYALIAYNRKSLPGLEAAIKYLILASLSTAFLLFGMAFIYVTSGTMEFSTMAVAVVSHAAPSLLRLAGLGFIIVGLGFKLAIVPFHFWIPDVYQGASAPIAAYIATVSKGAIFALMLRYFSDIPFRNSISLMTVFTTIAIVSMIVGNFLALRQNNLKRILAYSSIAHMGYLLVAFIAGGPLVVTAITFYLIAYFVTTLGAFGVITSLSGNGHKAESLSDYRSLAWRCPWLTGVLTAMLLSLAGIPLTAGFIGKFAVLTTGATAHLWLLLIVLIATSAVGLFYYLRVIFILFEQPEKQPTGSPLSEPPAQEFPTVSLLNMVALTGLTFCLIWFGIYPGPLLRMIENILGGISE